MTELLKLLNSSTESVPEPERYELNAGPMYSFEPTRREVFKALGAGLLMLALSDNAESQESGGGGRRGGAGPQTLDAWIHIAANGAVTVFTGKVEVGQNSRTALTQAVAEELETPVSSITLVMGDTALTPFDMGTFGSMTTPRMAPILRRAAASAREELIAQAAKLWGVEPSTLTAVNGRVKQTAGTRSAGYGELLKGEALTGSISGTVALKPAADWKVAGTSVPKVDGRAMVTGRHHYSSDIKRPGMLYGKVLRAPAIDAQMKSVDISEASKLRGVTVVNDNGFVGAAAPTLLDAERAVGMIHAEWTVRSHASDVDLYSQLRSGDHSHTVTGRSIQSTYTVAYIAHAPLEPRCAVAEWEGDHVTVWTGTQRPFGVRQELAAAFKLTEAQVHVLMPDMGSGYGGKHTGEAAVEAARLARATGRPVKLIWTREEEFSWAYFRPAGVIEVRAAVAADGNLSGWEMDNYNSGPSGINSPYSVSGQRCEFHQTRSPLRQGSYRGLAGTANHFARESAMDDLARLSGLDPLAFRLKNCSDERLAAVLHAAASKGGWTKRQKRPGRGYGIAVGTEKGSYIANFVELDVDKASGAIKLLKIVTAFECGAVVNPRHLENQVEGATVMGIGGALFEAIRYQEGKLTNPHFAAYRVPRFGDVPPIEVVLVNRKDLPSAGAGETPIMAISPAIRNAILDATGTALYTMPLAPNGLKSV